MRTFRSRRIAAAIGVTALLLAACGGSDDAAAPAPAPTPAPDAAPSEDFPSSPGLDDCPTNPTCNSGPRAAGGTITWLVDQGHDAVFNIHRPDGGSVYLLQAINGLLPSMGYFGPDGVFVWDYDLLAEEPQIINESPQTIQYKIRPEAVWSDGTPITVDDFLWHWYHNSGREDQCVGCQPRATLFWENVESIVGADNGRTVTITMKAGVTDPEWFGRGGLSYPAHWSGLDWKAAPEIMGATSEYFYRTIPSYSAGPYLVDSWDRNERVVMVPNPAWYGAVKPSVDRIVKEFVTDRGSWLPAVQNRELDGGSPASFTPELLEDFQRAQGLYTQVGSGGAVWEHVDFNTTTVTDVALRRAVFTVIDIDGARSRIFSAAATPPRRGNHIFTSASPNYVDHVSALGYGSGDVAAARAILAAAGYTGMDGGAGALRAPDGTAVRDFRFSFLAANQNRAIFVELAQSWLADIGIRVTPSPTDNLGGALTGGEYELVIFGWSGSPLFTTAPQQYWKSDSGSNFGKLNNAQVDDLVTQTANQVDASLSVPLANQASLIVLEEAYVLPMWDSLNFSFVSQTLANVRDNNFSSLRAQYNLQDWGILAN
jgi:peptide/nickel transport system substrate-binding protein